LNLTAPPIITANIFERRVGGKQFELSNHLGNVLTVVSDIRQPHSINGVIDYYEARIESAHDYYAFGAQMQKRGKEGSYRYGFNGKENDNEVKGEGNSLDFGGRIYDPRLGRWLSQDPLMAKKPDLSPYQSYKNNPIIYIDGDGKDEWYFNADGSWDFKKTGGAAKFYLVDEDGVIEDIYAMKNMCLMLMVPGIQSCDEDLADELTGRPEALALFKVLYPKHAMEPQSLRRQKLQMIPVDIISLIVSAPGIVKTSYKLGVLMVDFVKGSIRLTKGIVSIRGAIKFGNITYESMKALKDVTAKEIDFLSYADKLGETFTVLERMAGKTADFMKNGTKWELKTIEDVSTDGVDFVNNVKKAMLRGSEQSSSIIADMRNLDITLEQATVAAERALGSNSKVKEIRIIGDGFDKIIPQKN
jgi:RHS repeat-associated protein